MRISSFFGIGLLIVFISSCTGKKETETVTISAEEQSAALLDRHLNAFMNNDVNAILADYTEESRIFTPDSVYTGLEQIRSFMQGIIELFPKDSININMDKKIIRGNIIYIVWHGSSPKVDVSFASDTFIIEHDKIITQTLAAVMTVKE